MTRKTNTLVASLLLLAAPFANANICNNINQLANVWNELANATHDASLDGYSQYELDEIDDTLEYAWDATEVLADELTSYGNSTETRLGDRLYTTMDRIDAAHKDQLVNGIDNMVGAIDAITDYCDSY